LSGSPTAIPNAAGSLVDCIDRSIATSPDHAAVMCGSQTMSYRELGHRADVVASQLRFLGIGRGQLVAVNVGRCVELPAVLLGVLRAGAAYVPLDPTYPGPRMKMILDDTDAAVVVTTRELASTVPDHDGRTLILDEVVDRRRPIRPACPPDASDLAYVIFTSGSSGRPKGVMVEHGSVVNLLESFQAMLQLSSGDVLLSATTLLFDIAALELFLPLAVGAQVVIASSDPAKDPDQVLAEIDAVRPTIMQATPTLWRMLTALGWWQHPAMTVLCGGERLPFDLARDLLKRCHAVYNVYGPTETTVWSTACRLRPSDAQVSIGAPIGNTQLAVCDNQLRTVAPGDVGELLIAGAGLARGYWRRPDLTAERFVTWQGGRWYRTGDLVRQVPDGTFVCLGRNDHQVKLRGYRIETDEIETALRAHPAVEDAAVVLLDEGDEPNPSLVAFVVADPEADDRALRAHLSATLPHYMVPERIVRMDGLPLTANGKLDRRALSAGGSRGALAEPSPTSTDPNPAGDGPDADVLASVIASFERTLGRPVGADDDFFQMGGHSLLGVGLAGEIQDATGGRVTLRDLFAHSTPRGLAGWLAAPTDQRGFPPIARRPHGTSPQLSFAQEGFFMLNQMTGGDQDSFFNQRCAFLVSGPVDLPALRYAATRIVERHEILRTVFRPDGTLELRPPVPVEPVVLNAEGPTPQDRLDHALALAAAEADRPFDLERPPLLRVLVVEVGPDLRGVVVVLYHAASDWTTLDIVCREIEAHYTEHREGRRAAVPDLAIQYADFACWQRQLMDAGAFQGQLQYWDRQLETAEMYLLPTGGDYDTDWEPHGRETHFVVAEPTIDRLRAVGRAQGATLFMTLLAALRITIGELTGRTRLGIAAFTENRKEPETRHLVGLFPNIQLLVGEVDPSASFEAAVRRERTTCSDAHRNSDVPFHQLLDVPAFARWVNRQDQHWVLFYVHESAPWSLRLPNCRVETWAPQIQSNAYPPILGTTDPQTGRPWLHIGPVDLDVAFSPIAEGYDCRLSYNVTVFDAAAIDDIVDRYRSTLELVATHPTAPLDERPQHERV
jgi:amino acid adenylation domain-containing protein